MIWPHPHRLEMRVAFVQGGPGLEAIEEQAARLRRLSPERYQIEEHPTASARQRMIELLDGLRPGDELCLVSLDSFGLDVGDTAQMILNLADRGAHLLLLQEDGSELDIAESASPHRLLEILAALHRRRRQAPPVKAHAGGPELLTEAEIEDIRRLGRAGMSPRRIGLIYRRSPKCISDLLWEAGNSVAGMPAQRLA